MNLIKTAFSTLLLSLAFAGSAFAADQVNLNTADAATLELLPGVGEVKAQKIIDFRHKRPFKKVEELTRVKGFGKKTLTKLKPYLSISGTSTLATEDDAAE